MKMDSLADDVTEVLDLMRRLVLQGDPLEGADDLDNIPPAIMGSLEEIEEMEEKLQDKQYRKHLVIAFYILCR